MCQVVPRHAIALRVEELPVAFDQQPSRKRQRIVAGDQALYAMALLGLSLITLEVRGRDPAAREVQSLPRPTTEATRPAPSSNEAAPTVLGPGDLTPTPPPAVTPGGVVTGVGPPGPAGRRSDRGFLLS